MIESYYWKKDLLSHAKRLKPVKKPKRWSERLVVNFEKEIIISFFLIRKLFETHKLSSSSKSYKANIFSYEASGKKITNLNHCSIDTIYDLENEKKTKKGIIFIANQLIHSCTIFSFRDETRNWDCIYACSDFERNKTIYRIPVNEIIAILNLVGNDYPNSVTMTWSDRLNDYKVHTN